MFLLLFFNQTVAIFMSFKHGSKGDYMHFLLICNASFTNILIMISIVGMNYFEVLASYFSEDHIC